MFVALVILVTAGAIALSVTARHRSDQVGPGVAPPRGDDALVEDAATAADLVTGNRASCTIL